MIVLKIQNINLNSIINVLKHFAIQIAENVKGVLLMKVLTAFHVLQEINIYIRETVYKNAKIILFMTKKIIKQYASVN